MTVGTETRRTIHYSTIVNLATKWFSCCVHSKNEMVISTLVWFRGVRRCFLIGGADHVGGPTYL